MSLDIADKLKNWAKHARMGERRVLLEARHAIELARFENANMERLWGKSEGTWMKIRDEKDAEIKRLQEALTKIGYGPPNEGEPLDLLNQFVDIARSAVPQQEISQ